MSLWPEALDPPGAVITSSSNLPAHRWWKLNLQDTLQEQCVLSTAEPPLQSHHKLKIRVISSRELQSGKYLFCFRLGRRVLLEKRKLRSKLNTGTHFQFQHSGEESLQPTSLKSAWAIQ